MDDPDSLKNHRTSRDYEFLVETVIRQEMDGLTGVDDLTIVRDTKLMGLSGYTHQIDVAYRFRLWKTAFLIIVECKQYRKRVGVDDLLEFRSRIEDLRAHKGVFITSAGFQSGAIEFAKANGIALLILRGTKLKEILYRIRPRSPEEECRDELAALKAPYRNLRSPTLGKAIKSRFSLAPDCSAVIVSCDGVSIAVAPGSLTLSMSYRTECSFDDDERGIYFALDRVDPLRPDCFLKALVLHEIIMRPSDD